MKKKKKHCEQGYCENCANLIPIGEGDHICDGYDFGTPVMPISEYEWTDEYYKCRGEYYVEK